MAHSARPPCAQGRHASSMHPAPIDGTKSHEPGGESAHRRWTRTIGELADIQHGVVALWQLRDVGLTERALQGRAEVGSLHRIHRGVYSVGRSHPTWEGRLIAAVLACGSEAVLSHRSAADLWGLRHGGRGPIDVTAPCRRGRAPAGIAAHRDGALVASHRTSLHGIPCTTVARTLLDLAACVPIWELRKAVSEAEVLRVLDHRAVRALVKRHRGRRGVARLRMVMDEIRPETKRTRSEMEREFLRLCERAGLPWPEVNVPLRVGGRTQKPDFLWRDAGFILEADSRTYHDTDSAFQIDRKREQRFQLAGWRVSHCTWEQIFQQPRALAETVRALLHQGPTGRKATA